MSVTSSHMPTGCCVKQATFSSRCGFNGLSFFSLSTFLEQCRFSKERLFSVSWKNYKLCWSILMIHLVNQNSTLSKYFWRNLLMMKHQKVMSTLFIDGKEKNTFSGLYEKMYLLLNSEKYRNLFLRSLGHSKTFFQSLSVIEFQCGKNSLSTSKFRVRNHANFQ